MKEACQRNGNEMHSPKQLWQEDAHCLPEYRAKHKIVCTSQRSQKMKNKK
jgi:hypothetical protein